MHTFQRIRLVESHVTRNTFPLRVLQTVKEESGSDAPGRRTMCPTRCTIQGYIVWQVS